MMYCPECKAEYREGFAECADCQVRLVRDLPIAAKPEFVDLEAILSTGDQGQIALIKSVLDAEKIPYLAQGEQFSSMRAPIPVRFMVPREYIIRARDLLKNLL